MTKEELKKALEGTSDYRNGRCDHFSLELAKVRQAASSWLVVLDIYDNHEMLEVIGDRVCSLVESERME